MQGIKKKIRDNRYINWLLILSNWLVQGFLGADITEKIYKFFSTLLFSLLSFYIISYYMVDTILKLVCLGFIVGHTLNWIINTNFSSLLTHRLLIIKNSKPKLFEYLFNLQERLQNKKWILYSATFGSISKGRLSDSSDIDLSIVRKPGFLNGVQAMIFSTIEKKKADFHLIPLELWISDSPENSVEKFKADSIPVVITDSQNVICNYYAKILNIRTAKMLNI